jgi:peptide/nickel transport system permease protein
LASLRRYLIRRAIQGVITIFVVTIIIFFLFQALPGGPLAAYTQDPTCKEACRIQLASLFGLDKPWYVQLWIFLGNMFTLNFGRSFSEGKPVAAVLATALPRTLFLFGGALIVEYVLGIFVGRFIAWHRGKVEGGTVVTSLFFYNMPSFWIGLILLWAFGFVLPWFPLNGYSDPTWTSQHFPSLAPGSALFQIADIVMHGVLPMFALVLISAAGTILLMQTSMLEVLGEDFILTARAKGLSARKVRNRHAARNAYLPIVTTLAISLGFVIGGAIILEQVFSYYGMGWYLLQSILRQDNMLAGAILYLISILVILGNIVADVLYGVLDPRVRI